MNICTHMYSNMFNVVNSVINSKINGVPEFQRLVVMISDTVCIEVSEDSVNVSHIATDLQLLPQ